MNNASSTHAPARHAIAVFGATGGLGLQVTRLALAGGHSVRALVRSPERLREALADLPEALRGRLEIVTGSALALSDARRVIHGSTAVISALGAPALSKSRIRSEGTATIARAMELEGVDRLVAISIYGIAETRKTLPFFLRFVIFPTYLRRPAAEHTRQETIMARSGLRWTAVRPPNLTDTDETEVVHDAGVVEGMSMYVSRLAVAKFMLDQLDSDTYVGKAPGIGFPTAAFKAQSPAQLPAAA